MTRIHWELIFIGLILFFILAIKPGGSGGTGPNSNFYVNGTSTLDANLLDGDVDWTLNTVPDPNTVSNVIACTDCVTLATETTGAYVTNITTPVAGIIVSGTGAENATAILALADDLLAVEGLTLTGTIVRTATSVWIAIAPINDAVYIGDNGPNWTTSIVPNCVSATSALQYTQSSGVFSCGTISGGSGDSVFVNASPATDANFIDGDIDFTLDTGPSPDTISATVACTDCVALGTETTNAYVADLTGGSGISVSGGGAETANITVTTASSETDFLTSGALTCGAGTRGRIQVHTTPLQYCDNSGTPTLRYAAYGNSSGESTAAADDSVTLATDTTGNYVRDITGGDGISVSGGGAEDAVITVTTASSETNFLISGALTCGAATQGKIQVHTTPLQYCDNSATPTLRYAAYGEADGDALRAVQLVANGANCTAGNYPLGVDEFGAVETCTTAGDNISVNGVAAADANFNDTTPTKPSGGTAGHFQKDSATPNNISLNILPWELNFTSWKWNLQTVTLTSSVITLLNPPNWNDSEPNRGTILYISTQSSTEIRNIAGGTNGRLVLIKNATNPTNNSSRLILLSHGAGITLIDRMPLLLMPGQMTALIFESATGWTPVIDSRFWKNFTQWSELTGGLSDYQTGVLGTAASCQIAGGGAISGNYWANIDCDTGTTATGRAYLIAADHQLNTVRTNPALFYGRFYVDVASDSTQRYQAYAGWQDAWASTSAANGFYFLYDDVVSTNWRLCNEDSGAQVCVTSSIPVSTTKYQHFLIFIWGDWSNAEFFHSTNGVAWTLLGNIPNANSFEGDEPGSASIGINKTIGTTQRDINIDVMAWNYDVIKTDF